MNRTVALLFSLTMLSGCIVETEPNGTLNSAFNHNFYQDPYYTGDFDGVGTITVNNTDDDDIWEFQSQVAGTSDFWVVVSASTCVSYSVRMITGDPPFCVFPDPCDPTPVAWVNSVTKLSGRFCNTTANSQTYYAGAFDHPADLFRYKVIRFFNASNSASNDVTYAFRLSKPH